MGNFSTKKNAISKKNGSILGNCPFQTNERDSYVPKDHVPKAKAIYYLHPSNFIFKSTIYCFEVIRRLDKICYEIVCRWQKHRILQIECSLPIDVLY